MPESENKVIKADRLLVICWLIANAEAKNLGAQKIEPIHFLLGIMKIIDPKFPEQLDSLNISSEDWAKMCEEAQRIRNYIDVLPNRITKKRRGAHSNSCGKRGSMRNLFPEFPFRIRKLTLHISPIRPFAAISYKCAAALAKAKARRGEDV